jgi:geranylgeranyl reductase family protein
MIPETQIKTDILVIGAGPAGSCAARVAVASKLDVIILEKKKKVGIPVQCAEYVPSQLAKETELPSEVISQLVDSMRTHLPDGEVVDSGFRGFMINRDIFDQVQAEQAQKAGAKIYLGTKVLKLRDGVVYAEKDGQILQFKPKVIIGADGPYSIAGRSIGQRNKRLLYTAQHRMFLRHKFLSTEVFFMEEIPCGYGWIFPKGEYANVGVGVDLDFRVRPFEALKGFTQYLIDKGVVEEKILSTTGGAIPIGGLLEKICQDNILLVGDSAGMSHPITGAGVYSAVFWGKEAGQIASEAVINDELSLLKRYQEECFDVMKEPLEKAYVKRLVLKENWRSSDLSNLLRRSWIAFEDYYR